MAKTSYQNPVEKAKLHRRSELLKKSVRVLSDKLSRFGVQAVPLDNGQGEVSNIKIELSEKTSQDDVVKIKETIIETGRFNILPKEKCLLVTINIENIDSFGRGGAKEVIVPLHEKKTPAGLEKDPLIKQKASTLAEKLTSADEAVLVSSNGNPNNGIQNVSSHGNILEPIVLADLKEKQNQIQTIQNKEEMNKTKQDEIKEMIKALLIDQEIKYVSIVPNKKRKTMVVNLKNPDRKKIEKLKLSGVEEEGGEKAVHFNEEFFYKSKSSGEAAKEKKKSGPKKKTATTDNSEDDLENLFNQIRALKSGPDLVGASAKFEEVFPGKTLWLQDGESSKKISIESLLKKLLS